jgi:hypothetical protein
MMSRSDRWIDHIAAIGMALGSLLFLTNAYFSPGLDLLRD